MSDYPRNDRQEEDRLDPREEQKIIELRHALLRRDFTKAGALLQKTADSK